MATQNNDNLSNRLAKLEADDKRIFREICCIKISGEVTQEEIDEINEHLSIVDSEISDINDILPLKADLVDGVVPDSQLPSYLMPKYVNTYSDLPDPSTVAHQAYAVLNSQGTAWLPGSLGGTYYSKGIYFSDGTQWIFMGSFPYQATQSQVNAEVSTDTFVSPSTLGGWATQKTFASGDLSGTITTPTINWSNGYTPYDARYLKLSNYLGEASLANIQANTVITGWGDSFFGNSNSMFNQLSGLVGYTLDNQGVPGETSSQILTRFLAAPSKYSNITFITAGRNNVGSDTLSQALADIATMVSHLTHDNYIIIPIFNQDVSDEWIGGITYNKIIAFNDTLAATYPDNYFDLRAYMVAQYNPSLPQDVIDFGHDVLANSLRQDALHPNTAGGLLMAQKLASLFTIWQGTKHETITTKNIIDLFSSPLPIGNLTRNQGIFSQMIVGTGIYSPTSSALVILGDVSATNAGTVVGSLVSARAGTILDTVSAASATKSFNVAHGFTTPNFKASNSSVTYTHGITLYIAGPPTVTDSSTSTVVTNPWTSWFNAGYSYFGDGVNIGSQTNRTAKLNITHSKTAANSGVTGSTINLIAGTVVDSSTATSGTVTHTTAVGIGIPTFNSSNTGVTYTNASSLYIAGAAASTGNVTITTPWSLYVNAGNVKISTVTSGTWNGTAIAANFGGTGQTSYTIGDILYASASTTISKLADVATGNVLISGGVGAAPSYGKVGLTTHVSGILPIANGGTGVSTGLNTVTRTTVADLAYTVLTTDSFVAYTSLTTGRTVTLPTASTFGTKSLIVKDETGNAGTSNITVARSGSDTIDGATSKVINTAYGVLRLYSNGTNWFTQ